VRTVLQRGWGLVRRLAPALARPVDDRRRGRIRATAAVAAAVQFEERLAGVERELDLISKQLAVLTMRLEQQPRTGRGPVAEDEEARLLKARMSAVAFYEERISRLEGAAGLVTPTGDFSPAADSPR
jgi:hypothetical protein